MEKLLKVLMIEDSEADCLLIGDHLKQHGLLVWCRQVASFEELQRILEEDAWDVILSDYSVLQHDLQEFFSLVRAHMPDVPVILVSGSIGEEKAVDLLKMGFWDFVLKDGLDRLVPAIERSVREAADLRARREAEQKERLENEQRLSIALAAARTGIWEWNLRTDAVYWSSECFEVLGMQLKDNTLETFASLFHPDDAERVMSEARKALAEKKDFQTEFRLIRPDGKIRWIGNFGRASYDAAGAPLRMIGTAQDITERREMQDSLRQARARSESILAAVADVHILLDRQWRYLYVNEAAVRSIGKPREEILGRTLWEEYPDISGTELERQYRRTMEERLASAFDFYHPVTETWWNNRFYPAPEGLAVFATDITGRKKAEETVRLYAKELEETNGALRVMLRQRDEDRRAIEDKVHANVKQLVLPYLGFLKKSRRGVPEDSAYLNILESNLQEIISSFAISLSRKLGNLTPKEILIANLVKEGRHDKDIAGALNLSIDTIKAHRRNIRKKLGLSGEKTNLRTYLSSINDSKK